MELNFTEVAPVIRTGGSGPGPKPSPFEEPVKSIAGVLVKGPDGKERPKTLAFVADTVDSAKLKTLRSQIQNMGKRVTPEVTVHVDFTGQADAKGKPTGKTVVKFWTTPKIRRTRKA